MNCGPYASPMRRRRRGRINRLGGGGACGRHPQGGRGACFPLPHRDAATAARCGHLPRQAAHAPRPTTPPRPTAPGCGCGGATRRTQGTPCRWQEGADIDSAGSQFFVVLGDAPWLDGQYTVFGMVTEGRETVDRLASVGLEGGRFPEQPADPAETRIVTVLIP